MHNPKEPSLATITDQHETHGFAIDRVARLALNEAAFEHQLPARWSLNHHFTRYGDPQASKLRATIAAFHNVPSKNVLVTNGCDEALLLLACARLSQSNVAISDRTFAGHQHFARLSRLPTETFPLSISAQNNELELQCEHLRDCAILLANPHNPTGLTYNAEAIEGLIASAAQHGNLVVLDEAYVEFSDPTLDSLEFIRANPETTQVVVLRTFSKFWSLAGLRCGYLVASDDVIRRLNDVKVIIPYSVNRIALDVASELMTATEFARRIQEHVRRKADLAGVLQTHGIRHYPSSTNFYCAEWPSNTNSAQHLQAMISNRVVVKDLAGLGLPGRFRTSAGTSGEHRKLGDLFASLCQPPDRPSRLAAARLAEARD